MMTMNDNQNADNAQASSDDGGIVYVLTNPAMPGLVKIGKTTQSDVTVRINQLYTTGVPLPFDCDYAVKVADMTKVEKALHMAFRSNRVNRSREFFEIQVDQVTAILDLLKVEDVTPSVDEKAKEGIDAADKAASEKFKSRRPNLNFGDLRIPVNAKLKFTHKEATATVMDDRNTLSYEGENFAISVLTGRLLEVNYNVHPSRYWTYNGRLLRDIYDEFHGF